MSQYHIIINYYKESGNSVGHFNYTIKSSDGNSYTRGNNLDHEYYQFFSDDLAGLSGGTRDETQKLLDYLENSQDELAVYSSVPISISEESFNRPCNLTSGNSFGACAECPTEGHAPRWDGPLFCYPMKVTKQPWRLQNAARAGYGD